MTIHPHPNDLKVEHPANQAALDYAIALARYQHGHDVIPRWIRPQRLKPKVKDKTTLVHLNGEGLPGVQKDVFRTVYHQAGGRMNDVIKRLKISRHTAYRLRAATAVTALLLCAGCVTDLPQARSIAPAVQPESEASVAQGNAIGVPMQAITLGWNPSPDPAITAGYKIYYGPASGVYTNAAVVGNVTNAMLLLPDALQHYAATAYNSSGEESTFSNEIRVTGRATVIAVSATDQFSPDLEQWQTMGTRLVAMLTNATGQGSFRTFLTIVQTNRWRVQP